MKIYCTIIFLSLAFYLLPAQDKFINVHGGPKMGANGFFPKHKLWFTDQFKMSREEFSWQLGAFVEVGLGKHFAIQVEGLNDQFAFQWKHGEFTIIEKFCYIDVPILAKFKMVGFGLYGGYQWGRLNFAERKMVNYYPDDPTGLNKPYDDDWHSANRMYVKTANSILFGIEYTTRPGVGFSARYVKGLTDLTVPDIRNSIFVTDDEIYNSYFSVSVHWSFGKQRSKNTSKEE